MKSAFESRRVWFALPLLAAAAWAFVSTDVKAAASAEAVTADEAAIEIVTDAVETPVEVSAADEVVPFDESALMINNCTYYNNANHTMVVGQFGYDCCNNPVAWGKKTRYYVCGGCFPCFPPPQ